jgi:hypothetical protein
MDCAGVADAHLLLKVVLWDGRHLCHRDLLHLPAHLPEGHQRHDGPPLLLSQPPAGIRESTEDDSYA